MGMFDWVVGLNCDSCGKEMLVQSKGGPCLLKDLTLDELPSGSNYYGGCQNPECDSPMEVDGYKGEDVGGGNSWKEGYSLGFAEGFTAGKKSLD